MACATAGIGVDLGDQFDDGAHAIAHHQGRFTAGGGNQLVAHDQHSVIATDKIAFYQHIVAEFACVFIARHHRFTGGDVHRHAFALVAVLRLDDHRYVGRTNVLGGEPCVFGAGDGATFGHGHACGQQHGLGEFFVLGDAFGNRACGVHFSGLDAALFRAPTKLHQTAFGQTAKRHATRFGGFDDAACGGA